jgi:hypothetical protein
MAVDLGDDVAAHREGLAADRRLTGRALDAGVVGRATAQHPLDQHALGDGKVERLGDLGIDVAAGDAEVGLVDLPAVLELRGDIRRSLDRDGEADTLVAAALALDLGVDPDHLAGTVDQRAARVPGVDGSVGLDHVADREAVGRLDLALERGDDAARHRAVKREGVADRDHGIADLDL